MEDKKPPSNGVPPDQSKGEHFLTETLDLSGLFPEDFTPSGSFDLRGFRTTLFGKLLEALPIPALLIDLSGSVIFANRACGKISSAYEKIQGDLFSKLFPGPSEAKGVQSVIDKVFADRKPRTSEASLQIEESRMWGRMNIRSLRMGEKRSILCLVEDLTLEKRQLYLKERHNEGLTREIAKRIQTEQSLRKSEERYRSLVENAKAIIYQCDSRGIATLVNKLALKIMGCSEEKFIGKHYLEFVHPEYRDQAERFYGIQFVKKLPNTYYELPILTKAGETVWVGQNVQLLMEGDGAAGFQAIARDITKRRHAEEEKDKSFSLLRATLESTADGILVVDREDRIVTYNQEFANMWSIPESVLESRSDKEAVKFALNQLKDPEAFLQKVHELYTQPDAESFDVLEFQDGKVFERYSRPQRIGEKIVGRVWSFRDVTNRKKAENSLRESEERYRHLVDLSPDGIFVNVGGRFVFANKAAARIFGMASPDELIGKPVLDMVHPDHLETVGERMRTVLEDRKPVLLLERKTVRPDGTFVYTENAATPIIYKGDQAAQVVIRDITDRKKAQELLLQTEKHKAVADLATGVAHNFNNLLQITIGNSQLAIMNLESGELSRMKANLEQIIESSRFGAETVRRLNSFAKSGHEIEDSEPEVVDLADMVRQAKEMTTAWWKTNAEKKGIKIDLKLDLRERSLVKVRKNELFEVLVNLIRNAVEAMPEGGDIQIVTTVQEDEVVLRMRDTGMGMPQKVIDRLFTPFFTTKFEVGTGLGLATAQSVIENHGGRIFVESVEGKGATFTVILPHTRELPPVAPVLMEPILTEHMTVLVIDDMEPLAMMLKESLTEYGHTVLTALSGQEGLELFEDNPPDLVICDLGMPEMNGWQVGKSIRAFCQESRAPRPPFILLTGWGAQAGEQSEMEESGVDVVVEKPVDISRLLEVIRLVVEKKNPVD